MSICACANVLNVLRVGTSKCFFETCIKATKFNLKLTIRFEDIKQMQKWNPQGAQFLSLCLVSLSNILKQRG